MFEDRRLKDPVFSRREPISGADRRPEVGHVCGNACPRVTKGDVVDPSIRSGRRNDPTSNGGRRRWGVDGSWGTTVVDVYRTVLVAVSGSYTPTLVGGLGLRISVTQGLVLVP